MSLIAEQDKAGDEGANSVEGDNTDDKSVPVKPKEMPSERQGSVIMGETM